MNVVTALKVAARFLRSDLHPPLGDPGGACQVIKRIKDEVHSPAQQRRLIQEVMHGDDLTNQEAFEVYDADVESGNKLIRKFEIGSHAQYRMDLRGVKVNDLRRAFIAFVKHFERHRSLKDQEFEFLTDALARGVKLEFEDPQTHLFVTFAATTPGSVKVITTYWTNRPGHPTVPRDGCPI
jgi:hypothetical protein